jgi:hypothetical protein
VVGGSLIVQHTVAGTRGKPLKERWICENRRGTYELVPEHRKRSHAKSFRGIAAGS